MPPMDSERLSWGPGLAPTAGAMGAPRQWGVPALVGISGLFCSKVIFLRVWDEGLGSPLPFTMSVINGPDPSAAHGAFISQIGRDLHARHPSCDESPPTYRFLTLQPVQTQPFPENAGPPPSGRPPRLHLLWGTT